MSRPRLTYNAPVVLTFALAALVVTLLPMTTRQQFFAAHPGFHRWTDYLGLITHTLGHVSWDHYLGNFMLILLVGPLLEERHGSRALLVMMLLTALVTGVANGLFSSSLLMGASGIVFMMIVLASTANARTGELPLSFLAVALIYMGGEVYRAVAAHDDVSHLAHLIGGAAGAGFGLFGPSARRLRASTTLGPGGAAQHRRPGR